MHAGKCSALRSKRRVQRRWNGLPQVQAYFDKPHISLYVCNQYGGLICIKGVKTVEPTPQPFISSHLDYWSKRSQEGEEEKNVRVGRSETREAHASPSLRLFSQSQSWQFSFRLFRHYTGITTSPSEAASPFSPFVRPAGECGKTHMHTHLQYDSQTRGKLSNSHLQCVPRHLPHMQTHSHRHTLPSQRKKNNCQSIRRPGLHAVWCHLEMTSCQNCEQDVEMCSDCELMYDGME